MSEHHFNPCLIGRHPRLEKLGDGLAFWFDSKFRDPTGDCPCCMAVRVLVLTAVAFAAGTGLGMLL